MDDILNEQERLEVEKFLNNEVQHNAVKKVLLSVIYTQGTLRKGVDFNPLKNYALQLAALKGAYTTNEQLGQDTRAIWEGINLLENGFQQLEDLTKKVGEENNNNLNQAR